MAAFEGSQKSQLQGVSQQIARERLDGQVSAQDNMLSDVVTGLRRRPGSQYRTYVDTLGSNRDKQLGFSTDIGGQRVKIMINTHLGRLGVYTENWAPLAQLTSTYLQTTNRKNIRTTTVGDTFYILNKALKPALGGVDTTSLDPNPRGFFFIKTGAFDRTYYVTVDGVYTASYTTPAASVAGAAAQSTPEYIAQQLANAFAASGFFSAVSIVGAFVYLVHPVAFGLQVSTPMPDSYVGVSNKSYVRTEGDLPQRLTSNAHGYVVAVGALRAPTYFKYDYNRNAWLETGAWGSPADLIQMPLRLQWNGTTWAFSTQNYDGRFAGDDVSNPHPAFISRGITGMGSFQGRLVLLAGSKVCMSSAASPTRFYRSTVTSLVAGDNIEVGASANSSAAYEYCVPFQKDLLLFSEKYQALVPGGNVAITPGSASVVVTSTYEADMSCEPVPLGRTLVYPAPRSVDFYGMMEMVPSQYTDSQYLSNDVTAHLPKYLAGRCRFGVASSVSNLAVFASSLDYKVLYVHEYLWNGDEKVQQAWHRWTFPYDIADAFFTGSDINLLFMNGQQLIVGTIDPRIGTLTAQAERRPFLDLWLPATVTGRSVPIPASFQAFDSTMYQSLRLADTDMMLAGEEVGVETRGSTALVTVPSFEAGPVTMGLPWRSSFSPTTPLVKDSNGVVISSNKLTILRYMVGTANSSEYEAIVSDAAVEGDPDEQEMPALYWGSAELDLGKARVNGESTAILPCRTNAASTTLVLYTEGLGEMNIISLEYVCRYNQKLRRR